MGWKTVMKQQKLVEKMTIEEKAAILSGKTVWQTREIDRLSIPSIFLSDRMESENRREQEIIWD